MPETDEHANCSLIAHAVVCERVIARVFRRQYPLGCLDGATTSRCSDDHCALAWEADGHLFRLEIRLCTAAWRYKWHYVDRHIAHDGVAPDLFDLVAQIEGLVLQLGSAVGG